jgi:hypothetical protein
LALSFPLSLGSQASEKAVQMYVDGMTNDIMIKDDKKGLIGMIKYHKDFLCAADIADT